MGKGNSSKVNVTKWCVILGHSNWTICSVFNWFSSKIFPPFYPASHNKKFLYYGETGRKETTETENGKRELFKNR